MIIISSLYHYYYHHYIHTCSILLCISAPWRKSRASDPPRAAPLHHRFPCLQNNQLDEFREIFIYISYLCRHRQGFCPDSSQTWNSGLPWGLTTIFIEPLRGRISTQNLNPPRSLKPLLQLYRYILPRIFFTYIERQINETKLDKQNCSQT